MNPHANEQASGDAQPSTAEVIADTYDELEAAEEEHDEEIQEEAEAEGEEVEEAAGEEEPDPESPGEEAAEGEPDAEPLAAESEEFNEAPPERWPAELKEAYMQLPPNAKQLMLEKVFKPMQRTYTETTQQLSQMKGMLEPYLQTMQQHGNDIQNMGLDAGEAFRRQMAWAAHFARVGPEKGIADMQASYGLQAGGQEEAPGEYLTPVERAMKARLDQLESHLGNAEQTFNQRQQEQQQQAIQARAQSIRTELQSFTGEMKDGKPAHPHVEKVGHAMAGLIRGGLVEKFDEYGSPVPVRQQITQAYSLACQMDPSIRTASPRQKQGQVEQARRANQTVVGNTTSGQPEVGDRPIGDDIADIYDRLNRRTG